MSIIVLMPWWFWTILWTLLVLVALAVLGWLLVRLVSTALRAMEEFMKFSEIASEVAHESSHYQAHHLREDTEPAIFRSVKETYTEYEERKNERAQRRISRRINKRETLGQPQNVSDLQKYSRKGATHG